MEKINNVYFLRRTRGDGNFIDPNCKDLKHKVLICLSFFPNPELTWPGDKSHRDACQQLVHALYNLGLFDTEILHAVAGHPESLEIAAEFPNVVVAKRTFEMARNVAGISDIYLYDCGRLVEKHD